MERNEMIEVLMKKAKVSREEAEEVLQKHDWDVLDSIIYLERKGKVENSQTNTTIEVAEQSKEENKKESNENHKKKSGGLGEVIGKMVKFIGKVIDKGNENHFEIRKENKKPIKISLTISAILLIIAFWPIAILTVVGLFFGYKYSITGPDVKIDKVNDVFDKASESAEDIKGNFKDGYKGC